MEDDVYAEELLAILTNPHPSGIRPDDPYGQADDGIDRYDGYGRDFWVETLAVVEGEHGAELEVGFGLAVAADPGLAGVPASGSVRIPFDAEWRRLSGYDDPADYAPAVAREVGRSINDHVRQHRRGSRTGRRAPALPDRAAQWQILLDALASEGTAVEVAPGRIEVRKPEGGLLTAIVSPDQWEQVLAEHAAGDTWMFFADLLGPRLSDEQYVVFYQGDLVCSTREKLPPVRGSAW